MKVLVTGAGGSIGSKLIEELAKDGSIEHLTMLDLSELNLYNAEKTYDQSDRRPKATSYLLGDVRHTAAMDDIFREVVPDVVYHAAALKHVPVLEHDHNALEAIRTNVLGTRNVVNSAIKYGVKNFVLVSTDKAVEPSSLMGATKTFAEGYSREISSHTNMNMMIVRFGNVLGSSGSVVPWFQRQIDMGGPVTVTHPEMTRYMMKIEEAVYLLTEVCKSEYRGTYVLDMGVPIKILDLAQGMIDASGKPCEINFTGVRPGEKLHEKLNWPYETLMKTHMPKIFRVDEPLRDHRFIHLSDALAMFAEMRDTQACKSILRKAVDYDLQLEVL